MTFVVQLKGIRESVTEDIILHRLNEFKVEIEHVKLIKSSGLCTKALVKFKIELEAETFLAEHPVIDILDEPVWVERGFEHSEDDWQCSGCKSLNFSHREACFKCRKRRRKAPVLPIVLAGNDDISPLPNKFLLLQGIEDVFTSEQLYLLVKQFIVTVKRACLVIDKAEQRSKGFAFLQFESVEESQRALNSLSTAELFKVVRFGRDLCELAAWTSSANGIVYWDPGCELSIYPASSEPLEPSSLLPTKTPGSALITTPPVIFTSTRPVKRLQLQKWTQKASTEATLESAIELTVKAEFLDFQFLACKLCNECFESSSALKLHAQQSQLHADNYDAYLRTDAESLDTFNHRDRAAERRNVFAVDEQEIVAEQEKEKEKEKIRSSSSTSTSTSTSTIEDSIGAKMLRKMGWQTGKGLGKHETGIKEPIKAITVESIGAGLGAASLIDAAELGNSYSDRAKQARMKRYKET